MTRNLLPRLRSAPTPANIALGTVGAWSTIADPGELAKIEYKSEQQVELRTRIQSIPSPWARMLLFRAALDDPNHPAQSLVENEILDALEFAWGLSRMPEVTLDYQRVELSHLPILGDQTGSRRAQDVAKALAELAPRTAAGQGELEVISLTVALVRKRPVFASSPYTMLFTAEDAAEHASVKRLFDFAHGGKRRRLYDRPVAFQEYIAQVVWPQLYAPNAVPARSRTWGGLQGRMRPWLEGEIDRCVESATDPQIRARVSRPPSPGESDWQATADRLDLEVVNGQPLGEIVIYRQRPGAELAHSPLRLRSTRPFDQVPLVITADHFRGHYYIGAPPAELPPDLRGLDRTTLPGLGIQYPWVNPINDWFVDRLILLSEPIERGRVYGYGGYRWRGTAKDARFSEPHILLPLRAEFFRYFTPEDLDQALSINAYADGRIEVSLSVPIGEGEQITVQRTYDENAILNEHGPAFSLWPPFRTETWSDYILFRRDTAQAVAQQFAVYAYAEGRPLAPGGQERRTPLVEISVFNQAPEVFELRSTLSALGGRSEPVGVLLPRYRAAAASTRDKWEVGVDFGTSNTVVSVRGTHSPAPQIFGAADLALSLTEPSENTRHLMDAYFFPDELPAAPFGTAVVYLESLRSYELDQEPLGLRVNVPYTGDVDGYITNRVQGDLKWSADPHAHFLSASFLRHVLATVIASAIYRGLEPAGISFRWAYPRAFSPTQLNKLRSHWQGVLRSFSRLGIGPDALRDELDESRSVLRHFFNENIVQPAGDVKVIVDIGGGTSDIAMYGYGRVIALDSVLFGGRNLTGSRPQSGSVAENAFVTQFVAWAREHGLKDGPAQTYLDRGQVHLAFSYLVGTRWFQESGGALFTGHETFHKFQLLVFYFFGALFYYLGLSLRSLPSEKGVAVLPAIVLLAGNGSRYLDWLTDLVDSAAENVFARAFGELLAAGAGVTDSKHLPRIQSSRARKEEVARGLVAQIGPAELPDTDAHTTPVVGETVTLSLGESGVPRRFSPDSRFDSRDVIEAGHVHHVRWHGERLEIERFHDLLLRSAEGVTSYGDQWTRAPQVYRELFASLRRSDIQNLTEGRLQFLAQLEQGFRGSLFLLEATVVLEEMRDRLFRL